MKIGNTEISSDLVKLGAAVVVGIVLFKVFNVKASLGSAPASDRYSSNAWPNVEVIDEQTHEPVVSIMGAKPVRPYIY